MPKLPEGTAREYRRVLTWIVATALIFLFVWYAWELLFLAFAGLLLAIILRAMADWVQEHTRLSHNGAYATVVCGLAILISLIGWFIVPSVISQTAQILHIIPHSIGQAKKYLDQRAWGRHVVEFVQRAMKSGNFGAKFATIIHGMMDAVGAAVVVAVVGVYGGANPKGYGEGLLHLVPEAHRQQYRELAEEIVYTLKWWILGQLVPMVVLGIASMIGLSLLGVPLAFTLGLFTGFMIFIPYLGALLSEIPAVLVALSVSGTTAIYVIILYLGVHAMEGYILTPLVQKRAVRLLPIVTILAQFLMWILTGLLGVAIATPLTAAIWVVIKKMYLHEPIKHRHGFGA